MSLPQSILSKANNTTQLIRVGSIDTSCWSGPYPSSQSNSFEVTTNISNPVIGDWYGLSFKFNLAEVGVQFSFCCFSRQGKVGCVWVYARAGSAASVCNPINRPTQQEVTGGTVKFETVINNFIPYNIEDDLCAVRLRDLALECALADH